MQDSNHLSKKAHKFISPTDCRTARFFLLPTVDKPGNPGRPIISGNGSPTEHISLFVDSFLKPLVPRISSYMHDTPDFLSRILGIQHQVPSMAIIGTFDVYSLYTNIRHDEMIDGCSKALSANIVILCPWARHLTIIASSFRMGRKAVGPVCCVMHVKEPRTLIVKEKGLAPVFLDSRLEHPAGWICVRYKSSVLLLWYCDGHTYGAMHM